MSTKVAASSAPFTRTASIASTAAPPYTTTTMAWPSGATQADVELARLDASGRVSPSPPAGDYDDDDNHSHNDDDDAAPPPAYTPGAVFVPTVQLQIQTPGKPWLSLPLPPRPDPIPVYAVDPATGHVDQAAGPVYTSVRAHRRSGTCALVAGAAPADDPTAAAAASPLSTTTYRFGPGRPARVVLFDRPASAPADGPSSSSSSYGGEADHDSTTAADDADADADAGGWDAFPLVPRGLLTRAVGVEGSRLGGFEWRYATRAERRAAGATSLLVLDRVTGVFGAGGREAEAARRPVALLVRNAALRSPGSGASTAGNGGRLLLDLRPWDGAAGKVDRRMVEILAVTTAVSMLKKEVDRRRAHQIAIMAGAGSGGP